MARKADPVAAVIAFFATVSLDEAQRVLAFCKTVVAQRAPAKRRQPKKEKESPAS